MCIELDLLEEVDHTYCESLDKPAQEEMCDKEPCLEWLTEEWSEVELVCELCYLKEKVWKLYN